MDLHDQMRTFVRIIDTGRLAGAAKTRGMSLAAVSRQLSALEDDLGATLIVRSTRHLSVTDSGRRWYRYCVAALRELEVARADVSERDTVSGSVVVSAPASIGLAILVQVVDQLTRAHPALTVELRLEDHSVSLLGDGVDIAVRVGMPLPDSTSIVAHKLFSFRRALVTSRAYLRKHGTPRHPDELSNHELLAHTRASSSFTRWSFTKGDQTIEVEAKARLQSTSPLALREWAQRGAGITLIPDWFGGDLPRVLGDWVTPEISAYAMFRTETRSAGRMRVVLAALAGTTVPMTPALAGRRGAITRGR